MDIHARIISTSKQLRGQDLSSDERLDYFAQSSQAASAETPFPFPRAHKGDAEVKTQRELIASACSVQFAEEGIC